MNFINEVVNGGVTIILFVVTNPVCVPKKRNLFIFRGLKGAWKHIRTLNGKEMELEFLRKWSDLWRKKGVDPYHLDLVLLPLILSLGTLKCHQISLFFTNPPPPPQ
ncbi:hypothetical protein Hanom_Chr14g01287931 [Helianthus anomalus]